MTELRRELDEALERDCRGEIMRKVKGKKVNVPIYRA